jgi:hypothetical protein
MNDWGVAVGWINTLLLAGVWLSLYLTDRWPHLRWLRLYALTVGILSIVQLLAAYNHEFGLIKRPVSELLFLGVCVEALLLEAGKKPVWVWPAFGSLVLCQFLPIPVYYAYWIPQVVFSIGLSLELPTALRLRNPSLLAWSILGAGTAVSDAIKLIKPANELVLVLHYVDPLIYTAALLILYAGIYRDELLSHVIPRLQRLHSASWKEFGKRQSRAAEPLPAAAALPRVRVLPQRADDKEREIEQINSRLDMLQAMTSFSIRKSLLLQKDALTVLEISVLIGGTEEQARRWIEQHNLPLVRPIGSPHEVVPRAALLGILFDARKKQEEKNEN